MTDDEVVEKAEKLARRFYLMMGYVRPSDFKMREATHPQAIMCWEMACEAFDELLSTNPEDAVDNIEG